MGEMSLHPASPSRRTAVIAVVAVAAALLYLAGGRLYANDWLRLALKPLPVLCMALWLALQPGQGRFQRAVIAGLLLSAAGDFLLSFSESTFLWGLIAFLLGHVAYILAFFSDCRRAALGWAALAYGYGMVMYVLLLTRGELGDLAIPVLLYVAVICTMLWRAAARYGAPGVLSRSAQAGLLGALFFTLSDSVLAWNRFVEPVVLERYIVMLTYWAGQLGIMLAAAWQAREAWPAPGTASER